METAEGSELAERRFGLCGVVSANSCAFHRTLAMDFLLVKEPQLVSGEEHSSDSFGSCPASLAR